MSKPRFNFLGLAKKAGDTDEDKKAKERAKKAKPADDDEDEEDEEEEEGESEDDREARLRRNALRAAGHGRGVAAERTRLAAIMNGLAPGKVEMALHLALETDLGADQVRGTLDKAPAAGSTAFAGIMDRLAEVSAQPGFGGAAPPKGPTLAGQMAKLLKIAPPTR